MGSLCDSFRPRSGHTHPNPLPRLVHQSCSSVLGVECTFDELDAEAQQQEPYGPAPKSSCDCRHGMTCSWCVEDWCPLCGRYDRCPCDEEEAIVARHERRMDRLEVEAEIRAEMGLNPEWEGEDALEIEDAVEVVDEAIFQEAMRHRRF